MAPFKILSTQNQIRHQIGEYADPHGRMAGLNRDVLSLYITTLAQFVPKRFEVGRGATNWGAEPQDPSAGDFTLRLCLACVRYREENEGS